jgi:hypothetical protein
LRSYRVYSVDGAGKIVSADWIEAEDDAHALREAEHRLDGVALEVWDRQRLVGRIESRR